MALASYAERQFPEKSFSASEGFIHRLTPARTHPPGRSRGLSPKTTSRDGAFVRNGRGLQEEETCS